MNLDAARQAFLEEVAELLQSMEEALLTLEENPTDPEALNAVFRAMHTIKGTGGVFGYTPVVEFTHAVESVMDAVRSGREPLTAPLIATLFACRDHTARLVEAVVAAGEDAPLAPELRAAGQELLAQLGRREEPSAAAAEPRKYLPMVSDLWMIALDFGPNALRNGMDPLSFLRYLSSLGEIVDLVTLCRAPTDWDAIDPESCYLAFRIAFRSEADKCTIAGVFEFAEDDCDIRILPPDTVQDKYLELLETLNEAHAARIGELLLRVGAVTPHELERALARQAAAGETAKRRLGELLVQQGSVKPTLLEQAAKIQETARAKCLDENRFIRVDAERLGHLINLVGELVTSSAAIRVAVERAGVKQASEIVDGIDYLVAEIRDNALQLRMVPIGDSLARFRRVVRDASKELGKEIELVISGGETELDKTVVEKITDPLTHLVRNAVDHGIEEPAVRELHGKPRKGTIRINAYHDSGHIVIEIEDDGAGLNAERIRAKAEAQGLIKPEDQLSHEETLRLIFAPGLSTKDAATNLSGRGVGMDVVKRNIEALRGRVELDSTPGAGTRVTIVLPLTLAIIDGFLVGAGGARYVIPLSQVVECVEMEDAARARSSEHYINLRGEVLPFIRLTELFGPSDLRGAGRRESLVVARFGHHQLGLVVDTLFGELQTVIKPLGKLFERLRGISGATILGTGDIALILDIGELAGIAQLKTSRTQHPAGGSRGSR